MSLTSRFLGRASLFSISRVVWGQKCLFPKGPNPSRTRSKKPQTAFCQNHGRTYASDSSNEPCWKCGKCERESKFFCKDCNALQKPDSNYNYFKLLGLNESFDIDLSDLSKRFRQLQAVLHPDKFSNATDDERNFSADLSSLVNKAFRTLSNPLERGLYLLSLQGVPVVEKNTSSNKAFLLQIMELNEELESISTRDEVKTFHSRNKQMLSLIEQKVSKSFASCETSSARASLMEMQYFVTLEGKIKEKILQLEEVQ